MFFTWASMARSYDSKATPCTASSSWERVNTRPRLAGQGEDDLELGGGEIDVPVGHCDPSLGDVDGHLPHPHHRGFGLRSLHPSQDGPYPGHQLLGAERLDHVVVGSQLQARHPVGLVGPGGEHDDRDAGVAAQRPGDVQAVQAGEAQVEDDQVRLGRAGQGQRSWPVPGGEDGHPGVLQVIPHQAGDLQLVIDRR